MNAKRKFLKLAVVGLAGSALRLRRGYAVDTAKMSKAQAEYQDSPKGIAMCATCTLFVAPHACKVVDGEISANGWCNAYAMAD